MIDIIKCQICGKEVPEDDKLEHLQNNLRFSPSQQYRICSNECQEMALKTNSVFNLRIKIREMGSMSFETFNALMEFPIEGGYAEDKWILFRRDPMLFLHKLDESNLIKFVRIKI